MKHLFIIITFFVLSLTTFGQRESKDVQMRLNSITSAVEITKDEKGDLIFAIRKLIDSAKEIRVEKREHMKLELRENSQRFLTEVLIILDDERYEKWREVVKRKNNKSENKTHPAYPMHVNNMFARDPYVYADKKSSHYYMHLNDKLKIGLYKSPDLVNWVRVGTTFEAPADFWGTKDFWAPDTYCYKGKYYVFASFSNSETKMKGTSALVSVKLEGPYKPLVNQPITPADWHCLDGYLYIDDNGQPWSLFCRAFHSVPDGIGRIYAQKLSSDLRAVSGDPVLLFKASEAPWAGTIKYNGIRGYVTDSPFIYRAKNGELLMLWSSFAKSPSRYVIGVARSSNGELDGKWIQDNEPLNTEVSGGGHAMIFIDLNGDLRIAYHAPNKNARPKFYWLDDNNGRLKIKTNE